MAANKEYRVVLRTKSSVTLGHDEIIEFGEPKAEILATVRTLYRTNERGTAVWGPSQSGLLHMVAQVVRLTVQHARAHGPRRWRRWSPAPENGSRLPVVPWCPRPE